MLSATVFGPAIPTGLALSMLVVANAALLHVRAVYAASTAAMLLYLAARFGLPSSNGAVLGEVAATALAMVTLGGVCAQVVRRRAEAARACAALAASFHAARVELVQCTAELDSATQQLARARDVRRIIGAQVAALANDLSSTARVQASAAAEQAAAISQIAATMEELSRTAEEIAESARETLVTSEEGAGVVAQAVAGIEALRRQVQDVAQRSVTLATQSQSMGEIVEILNDIVNKIHLLSLNAAIEACAAGEHGRRFSVVAQQVKELARDAKRSTEQVKTLIQQTQAAASTAVAATEQATQEAERGTRLAHQSGEVIARIVQTAQTLSAATYRQQAASEQLLNTMRGVEGVARQSALSAGELAQSASELSSTAGYLQQIDDTGEGDGASGPAHVQDGAPVGVAQGVSDLTAASGVSS
jgi:methyl-accepting chemotaxis protein